MKIALVGKMHSGKTEGIKCFQRLADAAGQTSIVVKFAAPLYETQHIFSPEEKCRKFLQELSDLVKKHFGQDILSKYFEHTVSYWGTSVDLLCDDVRVQSDFETAKKLKFITIGIDASENVRKQRNPALFIDPDHKTEILIDYLLEKCDYTITNNGSIKHFEEQLFSIHKTIRWRQPRIRN